MLRGKETQMSYKLKTPLQRCDRDFINTVKIIYPNKSFTNATKEINVILNKLLYGTKK